MSFLKSENDKQQTAFVTKGDLIGLLVIGALAAGGYYYFQMEKEKSLKEVAAAQKVYETGNYVEALEAFRDLDKLNWKNDSLDSVIYATQSVLEDRRSNQSFLFKEIRERLEKGDSASVPALLQKFDGVEFLKPEEVKELDSWKALLESPSVDSAVVSQGE